MITVFSLYPLSNLDISGFRIQISPVTKIAFCVPGKIVAVGRFSVNKGSFTDEVTCHHKKQAIPTDKIHEAATHPPIRTIRCLLFLRSATVNLTS